MFWSNFIYLLIFALELLLPVVLCAIKTGVKKNPTARFGIFSLIFWGLCLFFSFIITSNVSVEQTIFYLFLNVSLYVFSIVFLIVCFKITIWGAMLCGSVAFPIQFLTVRFGQAVRVFFEWNKIFLGNWIFLIEAVFLIAILCFIYFTIIKDYSQNIECFSDKNSTFLCLIFILVASILTYIETLLNSFALSYKIILIICEMLYAIIVMFVAFALINQRQSQIELLLLKQLWNEDKKHYELQKESIDIINIKCHDLRHQIRLLREGGSVNDKMLSEIEDSINIYGSVVKTGNDVLDVVLSNFTLRCQKNNTQLTCVVNGEELSFIEESDLYSLFGNLLENALEYETSIDKKENRFISVYVKEIEGKVSIHCENYYENDRVLVDGTIQTNKADKNFHGFGIKSMKKIAEKYHGAFEITIAFDMFQVEMLLPVPNFNKEANNEK